MKKLLLSLLYTIIFLIVVVTVMGLVTTIVVITKGLGLLLIPFFMIWGFIYEEFC